MRASLTGTSGLAAALALALAGAALPASGQDEPVEVVPADEPAMEEYAPEEADEAAAETLAADEGAADEEPAEPLQVYVGADWVITTLSLSTPGATGASDFDSGMYRGRVGIRALEAVGLEAQFGFDASDDEPGSVETDLYLGLFVVPTATVFEVVELAFPVGYAQSTFGPGGATEDFRSIAYGIDAELPLRSFAADLPDLRFTLGWMVYYQKSDARAYGANAGVRYDFETSGAGNPLAGLGGWLAGLWPFGGDEPAAD